MNTISCSYLLIYGAFYARLLIYPLDSRDHRGGELCSNPRSKTYNTLLLLSTCFEQVTSARKIIMKSMRIKHVVTCTYGVEPDIWQVQLARLNATADVVLIIGTVVREFRNHISKVCLAGTPWGYQRSDPESRYTKHRVCIFPLHQGSSSIERP